MDGVRMELLRHDLYDRRDRGPVDGGHWAGNGLSADTT